MTNVLVTGAGGAAGVAVIRELTNLGHCVVSTDVDPLAAGLYLAEVHAVVPAAADPNFVHALADIVNRHDVEAVICTVSEEMVALAQVGDHVGLAPIWLPALDAIEACVDKWRFALLATRHQIPIPATSLGNASATPGPWIVKPRFGRGSRDIYAVDDPEELTWACRRTPQPVVQTRVEGCEFTVDLLTDRTAKLVGAVPRWRLETKAGISTKGRTFVNDRVVQVSERTLAALGLRGAANLQGFVTKDGEVVVIEVNPRFSGALPLSLAAGAELVDEFLRGTLGHPMRPERLRYRSGVTMTRHLSELFTSDGPVGVAARSREFV